jgi:tetratricopeptide (TPR) repeat protein
MRRIWGLVVLFCCTCVLRADTTLVLPFFNHSKSPNLDWIGESIAETVHDALASEGLLALDRADRLEAYRRLSLRPGAELTRASILKIGDSLDATNVMYGSYELIEGASPDSKGSIRIEARMINLKKTHQGPVFSETGPLEDLATLEVRLGWQALEAIKGKSAPREEAFVRARPAVRLDAVESYVRGLLATSAEQRHRYFTTSARLDDHFSQPCFQLGQIYWGRKDYKVAAGWYQRVSRTDPHFLEAQFFLGLSRYYIGDFAGAEESFQAVATTMPLNEVFNNLGAAQYRRSNPSGAIGNFQKALDGDSADPDYHFNLGYALWRSGKYDAAVESLRAALARNPNDAEATAMLGRALKREPARPGDAKVEGRERVKTNYDEAAYRQLQAELAK